MPPRRLKRRAIERMVQKRVNEAIAEYGRSSANPENAGGSVPANAWELLSHLFEKLEQVFEISKCAEEDKVKFVVCTFEIHALTWWNVGIDVPDLVTPEKKKTERYIRGLPERVKANVTSSKPASLHDAINIARELIEQAIQGKATRIGKSNKRKWEDHQRNNNNRNTNTHHQQQNRRQEVAKAYATAPAEGRGYTGNLPLCNRYKAHHYGPCSPRCDIVPC
ncbi:hypothetical protein Tco_1514748 [Tanacetum coccineum]